MLSFSPSYKCCLRVKIVSDMYYGSNTGTKSFLTLKKNKIESYIHFIVNDAVVVILCTVNCEGISNTFSMLINLKRLNCFKKRKKKNINEGELYSSTPAVFNCCTFCTEVLKKKIVKF